MPLRARAGKRQMTVRNQTFAIVLGMCVSAVSFGCSGDKPAEPSAPAPAAPAPAAPPPAPEAPKVAPLRVAYSDWPGWTAFEVGIQKGWFKEAGIEVEFSWFDYLPSMEAFSAGKVDAENSTSMPA